MKTRVRSACADADADANASGEFCQGDIKSPDTLDAEVRRLRALLEKSLAKTVQLQKEKQALTSRVSELEAKCALAMKKLRACHKLFGTVMVDLKEPARAGVPCCKCRKGECLRCKCAKKGGCGRRCKSEACASKQ